jgi:cellulose synthase (UDP-forming)
MYGATMYAYLAPLWTVSLMLAPLVFFFTGVTPIRAFDVAFFAHVFPFLVASRVALLVGTWGVSTWRSEHDTRRGVAASARSPTSSRGARCASARR